MQRAITIIGILSLGLIALSGCGQSEPAVFRLDMTQAVSKQVAPAHQQAIADILEAMFGTPDRPFAMPETGLDQRKLEMAAGPVWSDERGGKHGLYRRHCAHCHGISGDGLGPTAMILNPYPRDYRSGVFKFKRTYTPAQPTDDDLRAVLRDGIPATAMPSFALLPPDEIDALVEYVKYLSMRGQMETELMNFASMELDPDESLDPAEDAELRELIVDDLLALVVEGWHDAAEQVMVPDEGSIPPDDRTPDEIAASVAMGRELFHGTKANCFSCHGPTGLGDGQQTDFDKWSETNRQFIQHVADLETEIQDIKARLPSIEDPEQRAEARADLEQRSREYAQGRALVAHMLPPRNAIPRNLRDGVYRGGQRPIDIYWRVSAGIPGTPMPAGGPTGPGAPGTLTDEEIWQLVDYVHSLPFEPSSRPARPPVVMAGEIGR